MSFILKILACCVGMALQTVLWLMVIGATELKATEFPILPFLILVQVPLITAIWVRNVPSTSRLLAYLAGLIASFVALKVLSPYLSGAALSSFSGAIRSDLYGFLGAGMIVLVIFSGCILICGILVPRAVILMRR